MTLHDEAANLPNFLKPMPMFAQLWLLYLVLLCNFCSACALQGCLNKWQGQWFTIPTAHCMFESHILVNRQHLWQVCVTEKGCCLHVINAAGKWQLWYYKMCLIYPFGTLQIRIITLLFMTAFMYLSPAIPCFRSTRISRCLRVVRLFCSGAEPIVVACTATGTVKYSHN